MLIFSGYGFLVPIVTFGCLVASEFSVEAITKNEAYYQDHGWPKSAAFFASAIVLFLIGRYVGDPGGRLLTDPNTGEEFYIPKNQQSFFFIPLIWWPAILACLGAIAV